MSDQEKISIALTRQDWEEIVEAINRARMDLRRYLQEGNNAFSGYSDKEWDKLQSGLLLYLRLAEEIESHL